jgi:hypothetical protein
MMDVMNPPLNSLDISNLNDEEKLINQVLFERQRSDKNIYIMDEQ